MTNELVRLGFSFPLKGVCTKTMHPGNDCQLKYNLEEFSVDMIVVVSNNKRQLLEVQIT